MPKPPSDDVQYLDLADYLWLAGAAIGDVAVRALDDGVAALQRGGR